MYHGLMTYPKNTETKILNYKGKISNDGKHDGWGEISFTDGSKYQGIVKDGEPSGLGTGLGNGLVWFAPNDTFQRSFYNGEMKNGEANGQGRLHYYNKQFYVGEMKNGHPHGSGSLKNKLGIEIKKGIWESGKHTIPGTSLNK